MALLNFLYKDQELANSLYAQIFNGLMHSVECGQTKADSQTGKGKFTVGVFGGGVDGTSSSGESHIERTNPHDVVFIDVLKRLEPDYKTDIAAASPGDILFSRGDLYIIDKEMIRMGFEMAGKKAIENLAEARKNHQIGKMLTTHVKNIIDYQKDDSNYIILPGGGGQITGVVKNKAMSDSVSSYAMKFGPFPVRPVCVVGIVEDGPAKPADSAVNPFSSGNMNQAALQVARMIFAAAGRQPGAVSVKPLALFTLLNTSVPQVS